MKYANIGCQRFINEVYIKKSLPFSAPEFRKGNQISCLDISYNGDIATLWIDNSYFMTLPLEQVDYYFLFPKTQVEKLLFSPKLT